MGDGGQDDLVDHPGHQVGSGLVPQQEDAVEDDARQGGSEQVEVDVRSRREAFTITKPPFVTPGVREP